MCLELLVARFGITMNLSRVRNDWQSGSLTSFDLALIFESYL
jgi:hypothetical protein